MNHALAGAATNNSDGVYLSHSVAGKAGPVITLLHPIGLDHTWWADHQEALSDGYRVLAVSMRGHGASPRSSDAITAADLAADVVALWDTLAFETSHVVGVSLGGMVAQTLAARVPERVESLVLVATSAGMQPPQEEVMLERARSAAQDGMESMIEATIARWFSSPDSATANKGRQTLRAADPFTHADCWRVIASFSTPVSLAHAPFPVLVVSASADVSTPPAVGAELCSRFPNAQHLIVPGRRHLWAFEDPDSFTAILRSFL